MEKEKIKEITTLVEKQWEKYPKADNTIFYLDILQRYKLTDADWEEVMKEYNRRTDKMKRKLWISKNLINPLLNLLSYAVMIYTSLFVLISFFNIYTLPSQVLFPNGTYPEREQFVNGANLAIVIIGLFVMSTYVDDRNK
jgi:uncharacterized protein YhhL (DUF1145 family)